MGVPGLKTWLQKEMPRTWGTMQQAVPPTGAEHIYVDLNFVLHNCLHRCRPKTRLKLRRLLEVWLNQMLEPAGQVAATAERAPTSSIVSDLIMILYYSTIGARCAD